MTQVARANRSAVAQVSPDELIGYVNVVGTATKKGSFYNEGDEHTAALNDAIAKMRDVFPPFPVLMTLSGAITDDARIMTAVQVLRRPAAGHDRPAVRGWECAVIQQMFTQMPPTRVFDLFNYLAGYRRVEGKMKRSAKAIGRKYTRRLATDWLKTKQQMLDFWSVKYQKDMRVLARHNHINPTFFEELSWLFGGEAKGPNQVAMETCQRAPAGSPRTGPPPDLWKLPYENARGLALNKFGISKEEFEEKFSKKGQKTQKEARTSAKRTRAAGGEVTYDPSRARDLFELFVYLGGQESIPRQASGWIANVAAKQARQVGMHMDNCAVILDTSQSMSGTPATPRHPLFKALSIMYVVKKSTDRFNAYYTGGASMLGVIPKIGGPTGYAQPVLQALKDGFTNIMLLGDGYENSPEGMTHRLIHTFKKKLDPENKVAFINLNPVAAAETSGGVREISPHIPAAGIRDVKALPSAMFVALAKTYPMRAIESYYGELLRLQTPATYSMLPTQFQRALPRE